MRLCQLTCFLIQFCQCVVTYFRHTACQLKYGYYQSNDVYMLQLEVTKKHLGCIRIFSAVAKRLLNYTRMPSALAHATFVHHLEASIYS
jgi:hypothetical protein